ncbi:MAG: YbaB/EbfC family nucleoid-associated protein [bacterium]|jgi:DNA-binding YbaB/EbfC family protein
MNVMKMMQQAKTMQKDMERIQAQLAVKRVEFSSGGGMVTATATGDGGVVGIKIDPKVINPADKDLLEDMVLAAVDGAIRKSREMASAEMAKVTAGMGLPGMFGG